MTKNERVKAIRKELKLTLDKFSSQLGVTLSAVSFVENGKRNLTNQMATSICKIFNVNPEWLENGTGEMFLEVERDEQFYDAVAEIDFKGNELIKQIVIEFAKLPENEQQAFTDFAMRLLEKTKEAEEAKKNTEE